VPLRGTLQIEAVYYRAEQNWQISKAQREEMAQTPQAKWKNADRQKGAATTLELSIPCVKAGWASECTKPPVVLEDEKVWVPDIFYNERLLLRAAEHSMRNWHERFRSASTEFLTSGRGRDDHH
jgi:hypothetical protein